MNPKLFSYMQKRIVFLLFICNILLPIMNSCTNSVNVSQGLGISIRQISGLEHDVFITNESQNSLSIVEPLKYLTTSSLYFVLEDTSGAQMIFSNRGSSEAADRTRSPMLKLIELQPGQSLLVHIDFGDGTWLWPGTFSLEYPVQLKACYTFPKSSSGTIWSGWVSSKSIPWRMPMNHYATGVIQLYDDESWLDID